MIFLSYSHLDKPIVNPLAETLRKVFGQERVFFDAWSIQPGDSIIGKINSGLESCEFCFFFVSQNSLKSKMAAVEWGNALMKNVRNSALLVPVKIDSCEMPAILTEKLYIDMSNYGFEYAERQIIEVASGKNTYNAESVAAFQNIVAYLSGDTKTMMVEFRAEAFTEPHSKYMILLHNQKDEVECTPLIAGMFEKGFLENVKLSDGRTLNAVKIGRSEATSPRFPFKVEIRAKGDQSIKFAGAMRADSIDSYVCVQCKGSYGLN